MNRLIVDIPEDIKKELKLKAVRENTTIKALIIEFIQVGLKTSN